MLYLPSIRISSSRSIPAFLLAASGLALLSELWVLLEAASVLVDVVPALRAFLITLPAVL